MPTERNTVTGQRLVVLDDGRNVPAVTIDAGNGMPGYDALFDKLVIGNSRDTFRDAFFNYDTTKVWQAVQTGAGALVSLGGTSGGSRYLNIATGVGANEETIILSRTTFKMPCKLLVGLTMSQRIASQEVYVELVGVDSTGAVETESTFASPNVNNATNAASFKFDGTAATSNIYTVRGNGIGELVSAASTFATTAPNGTSPNFQAATIFEIAADMEEVFFAARNVDSLGAQVAGFKRTQCLPDPSKDYKVRVRVKNLAPAPASTTSVRIHSVRVLDMARLSVDFARHMGRASDAAASLPTAITGALPTGFNTIGGISLASAAPIVNTETTTALAASATFTGPTRDAGATNIMRRFVATAFADQAGTFRLEMSTDNTTWRRATADTTVAANAVVTLDVTIVTRYCRCVFVNGATAQGAMLVASAFHKT